MVRTRVGYAGGTAPDPTYARIGDHTETLQIDFDPEQISYAELLAQFWASHDATSRPYSRQYMSIIFAHDAEQRRLAEASRDQYAAERGRPVYTEVVDYAGFTLAEEYHQKYHLKHVSALWEELRAIYSDPLDFLSSTAVARVNGYVSGYGTMAILEAEIEALGLSAEGQELLLDIMRRKSR